MSASDSEVNGKTGDKQGKKKPPTRQAERLEAERARATAEAAAAVAAAEAAAAAAEAAADRERNGGTSPPPGMSGDEARRRIMERLQGLTPTQLSQVADKLSAADHPVNNDNEGGSRPTSPVELDNDIGESTSHTKNLDKMIETLAAAVRQQSKDIAGMASQSALNNHTRGFHMPKPPSYAGSADERISAINFLKQYERYLSMIYPTHDAKVKTRMFPACLTGRAYRWLGQLNDHITSNWTELKEAFIERFTSMNHLKLESSYRFREQQESESVAQYTDAMELLLDQSDLDIHAKVDYYVRGLKRSIALPVFSKKPKSLEEAEKFALETEMLKADTAHHPSSADLRQLKAEIETLCANVKSANLASVQQNQAQSPKQDQTDSKPRDFSKTRSRGNNRGRFSQQNRQDGMQYGQVIDHRYQQLPPNQQNMPYPPPQIYYNQPPPAPYQQAPASQQQYQQEPAQRNSNNQGYSQSRSQNQGN